MVEYNRNLMIGMLAVVVFAAGCTQTGGDAGVSQTPNTGISILSFDAFPNEVPGDTTVQVEMEIQNTGGQTAENVEAELFNIPFDGGNSWNIESGPSDNLDLESSDPQAGVPSSPRTLTWTVNSPGGPENTRIPYDIYADVEYDYSTVATTELQIMSQERFRNTGATRGQPTVDNSVGPVQMDVRTRSPIVYYAGGESTSPRFCVVVRNTGQGTPVVDGEEDTVELSITSTGQLSVQPEDDDAGQEVEVDLVGNRGVACYETSGALETDRQVTLPISMTADYSYNTETSTSVTVDTTRQ